MTETARSRDGRAFEALVEQPGWQFLLEWMAGEDAAAAARVLKVDPRDSVAVARAQGAVTARALLVAHVQRQIAEYQKRLAENGQNEED